MRDDGILLQGKGANVSSNIAIPSCRSAQQGSGVGEVLGCLGDNRVEGTGIAEHVVLWKEAGCVGSWVLEVPLGVRRDERLEPV